MVPGAGGAGGRRPGGCRPSRPRPRLSASSTVTPGPCRLGTLHLNRPGQNNVSMPSSRGARVIRRLSLAQMGPARGLGVGASIQLRWPLQWSPRATPCPTRLLISRRRSLGLEADHRRLVTIPPSLPEAEAAIPPPARRRGPATAESRPPHLCRPHWTDRARGNHCGRRYLLRPASSTPRPRTHPQRSIGS